MVARIRWPLALYGAAVAAGLVAMVWLTPALREHLAISLLAAGIGLYCWNDFAQGRLGLRGGEVTRRDRPAAFWAATLLRGAAVLALLVGPWFKG